VGSAFPSVPAAHPCTHNRPPPPPHCRWYHFSASLINDAPAPYQREFSLMWKRSSDSRQKSVRALFGCLIEGSRVRAGIVKQEKNAPAGEGFWGI